MITSFDAPLIDNLNLIEKFSLLDYLSILLEIQYFEMIAIELVLTIFLSPSLL